MGHGGGQPADDSKLFGPDDLGLLLFELAGAVLHPVLQLVCRLFQLLQQACIFDSNGCLGRVDFRQTHVLCVEGVQFGLGVEIEHANDLFPSQQHGCENGFDSVLDDEWVNARIPIGVRNHQRLAVLDHPAGHAFLKGKSDPGHMIE